jgi:hypothetical protein
LYSVTANASKTLRIFGMTGSLGRRDQQNAVRPLLMVLRRGHITAFRFKTVIWFG